MLMALLIILVNKFKRLEDYIHEIHPNVFIKKITSDKYCVIRAFQDLLLCYDYEIN